MAVQQRAITCYTCRIVLSVENRNSDMCCVLKPRTFIFNGNMIDLVQNVGGKQSTKTKLHIRRVKIASSSTLHHQIFHYHQEPNEPFPT